jgi:hypothetical protein
LIVFFEAAFWLFQRGAKIPILTEAACAEGQKIMPANPIFGTWNLAPNASH